jgi:dihydroflavonol-4-reductase
VSSVVVTGGTGYVAGWCIVQLLEAGYDVVATVRSPQREPQVRAAVTTESVDPGRLTIAVADLNDDRGWDEAMAGSAMSPPRTSSP